MDGIIFDVDGTLWDSTDSVAESWNLAIRENSTLDLTIDGEILQGLFGKTMTEIADALFPSLSEKERMDFIAVCFDYENRYLETHPGRMYDGVVDTVKKLSEKYPLFIVSNCQCGYIEAMLNASGLGSYIKDHLCFAPAAMRESPLYSRNTVSGMSLTRKCGSRPFLSFLRCIKRDVLKQAVSREAVQQLSRLTACISDYTMDYGLFRVRFLFSSIKMEPLLHK